jgi:hypothetical protein
MKKGKIIAISQPTGENAGLVLSVQDGQEVVEFYYNLINGKKLINAVEKANGLPSGTFIPEDFIGADYVGNWESYAKGDKRTLDAQHPLVTDGATVDLTIIHNGKEKELKQGEKAQVGDIYVYPKSGTRRDSVCSIKMNSITVQNLQNRLTTLKASVELRKLNAELTGIASPSIEDELDV